VSVVHGGYSESRIRAKARAHQRRIRAGLGVKARDLDPMTKEFLRQYAEGSARAELLPPDSRDAWTAFNSTTRALRRLEERLSVIGLVDRAHGFGVENLDLGRLDDDELGQFRALVEKATPPE
jgi:hypothetical protein